MSQHTPGPWEVRQAETGKVSIYPIAGAYRVADSYDGLANARLIAAAPEMHDFIKRYMRTDSAHSDHLPPKPGCLICEACALLARIEGEVI